MKDYSKFKYAKLYNDYKSINILLTNDVPVSSWLTCLQNVKVAFDKDGHIIITGDEMVFQDVRDLDYACATELKWLHESAYKKVMAHKYWFLFSFGKLVPKMKFLKRSWKQLSKKTTPYYKHSSKFIITVEEETISKTKKKVEKK